MNGLARMYRRGAGGDTSADHERLGDVWRLRPKVDRFLDGLGIWPDSRADILSETFVVAWRRLADIPIDDDGATGWLCEVARRLSWNHRRTDLRQRRLTEKVSGTVAEVIQSAIHAVEDERLAYVEAWAELSERERLILQMSFRGASLQDIADAQGSTVRAATMARQRARARLESLLN